MAVVDEQKYVDALEYAVLEARVYGIAAMLLTGDGLVTAASGRGMVEFFGKEEKNERE